MAIRLPSNDPGWLLRHEDWLKTTEGRAYTAEQARSIEERMAEIRGEHRRNRCRSGLEIYALVDRCAAARFGGRA